VSSRPIGFDRKIELSWLEMTAQLVAEGFDVADVKARLDILLEGQLSNEGVRSAKSKTITVLMRVWSRIPNNLHAFRHEALALLHNCPRQEEVAVHWGMCSAAYPFFVDLAAATGRLLRLQATVGLDQIKRRLIEIYGERSTLHYALQRVARSLVDWGTLSDTEHRGVYVGAPKIDLTPDKLLQSWLIEALLISSGQEMRPFDALAGSLALFPFAMDIMPHDLRSSTRLEIFQQGLNEDYVMLKEDRDKG